MGVACCDGSQAPPDTRMVPKKGSLQRGGGAGGGADPLAIAKHGGGMQIEGEMAEDDETVGMMADSSNTADIWSSRQEGTGHHHMG